LSAVRVLIVDDNPLNAKLLKLLLMKHGFEVATAANADETMEVLKQFVPRLILMDLQLPIIDGFELTRRLKREPALADVRIIALTAYAMKGDDRRALEAGCDGYIPKPIDTRTLPSQLAEYVARGATPRE
jgi:CheY-like chemotaxis protein